MSVRTTATREHAGLRRNCGVTKVNSSRPELGTGEPATDGGRPAPSTLGISGG